MKNCRIRVQMPFGDTGQYFHGFFGEWQDQAGAVRDAKLIKDRSDDKWVITVERSVTNIEGVDWETVK